MKGESGMVVLACGGLEMMGCSSAPHPTSYELGGVPTNYGAPGSVKPDYLSPDAGQAYFIHKLEPEA